MMDDVGPAVAALRAGDRATAYLLLRDILRRDHHNALAWLWLSEVTDEPAQQKDALRRFLALAPDSPHAGAVRRRLRQLEQPSNSSPTEVIVGDTPPFPIEAQFLADDAPDLPMPTLTDDELVAMGDPLTIPSVPEPAQIEVITPPADDTPADPSALPPPDDFAPPPLEEPSNTPESPASPTPELWVVVAVGLIALYLLFNRRR